MGKHTKRILVIVSSIYGALLVTGIILFFVVFSSDPKLTFIFQFSSMIIFLFFGTYPLYLATSKNLNFSTRSKILCYTAYLLIEAGVLFLSFELFYNYSFFRNPYLDFESFKNVNNNLTSIIWPFMIVFSATEIILPSIKLAKGWNDWTLWLIIPLGSVGGTAIVAFFLIYLAAALFMGFAEAKGSESSSDSTSNGDNDEETTDEDEEEKEKVAEEPEKKNCRLRSPGEDYYDGEGRLRSPGEDYYDYGN